MKQWGFVFGAVAVIAALFLADHGGYERGEANTNAVWQARETSEVTELNVALADLYQRARDTEQKHAADIAAISSKYQQELRNARNQSAVDRDSVRAGTLRLRDHAATGEGACRDSAGKADTGASGSVTAEGSYLSGAAAEFLLRLANEADEVVIQLTECQAVVMRDRQ